MKFLAFLMLAINLVGCASADLISTRNNPRSGIVEYKNNERSEEKALKIAAEFCGGDFNILGQDSNSQAVGYQFMNGAALPLYRSRTQLIFSCPN
jgi:hypothetical protein